MTQFRPLLYVDTDTADIMDSNSELCVPPNTPMISQKSVYNMATSTPSESTESLACTQYSNSPLIFGASLPWALATLELEHRLRTEEDSVNDDDDNTTATLSVSPMDPVCTDPMPPNGLDTACHVESFVHPTHVTTRTVIRPSNPKSNSPFAFLRPSSSCSNRPVVCPSIVPVSRPTSPVLRAVSPLASTLKAFKFITDTTLFEEDLDYYEHRWMMEQAGQGRVEVRVTKHKKITVEYMYDPAEDEDEVVYPRRHVSSLFEPSVLARM